VQWDGDVEMIVFVQPGATGDQLAEIETTLNENMPQLVRSWEYFDATETLAEADRLFAGDPATRAALTAETIPTQYKIVPTDASELEQLKGLAESWRQLPGVNSIRFAEDQLSVISKLKSFVSLYTVILSIVLLLAAILLIWNTIRTAMFARRREIEVMKLVGATDWFIRVPFMLEGLIQGLVGGLLACFGLGIINNRWRAGVAEFPTDSGFAAMVVDGNFALSRMIWLVVIGMLAGAIGAGIAASRFLDV
jgi:cell division transport system permease protein